MYRFTASDASAGDWFGSSVAIRGDKIIIGATGKDLPAKGQVGGTYIYHFTPDAFTEEAILMAHDPDENDYFGWSVSISGDYAIVGAWSDDEGGSSAGAAYIIRWDGSNWTELEKLIATGSGDLEMFGCSVSMDGDYAIAGSYGDDNRGSAFVYNHVCPTADLDDDCCVDYYDLDIFTDFWLETGCDVMDCNGADYNGNGDVNFVDYVTLASQWQQYN